MEHRCATGRPFRARAVRLVPLGLPRGTLLAALRLAGTLSASPGAYLAHPLADSTALAMLGVAACNAVASLYSVLAGGQQGALAARRIPGVGVDHAVSPESFHLLSDFARSKNGVQGCGFALVLTRSDSLCSLSCGFRASPCTPFFHRATLSHGERTQETRQEATGKTHTNNTKRNGSESWNPVSFEFFLVVRMVHTQSN